MSRAGDTAGAPATVRRTASASRTTVSEPGRDGPARRHPRGRGPTGSGPGAGLHPDVQRAREPARNRSPAARGGAGRGRAGRRRRQPRRHRSARRSDRQLGRGVHVLHRTAKSGLGAAYIAGFAWGLIAGYDVLVEMDADGSHQPEELPRLLAALRSADVVLGSRWVPGGEVHNWPASRLWLSRGGNAYVRLALGMPLRDATGGYRAYRRGGARSARRSADVASQGYCFQVDLVWQAWRGRLRRRGGADHLRRARAR